MKKILVFLAVLLLPVMLFGQQKYIDCAMKKGNVPKGQFRKVPDVGYFLNTGYVVWYCHYHGYEVRNIDTVLHYKDKRLYTVKSFEILPQDEVDEYIYTDKCEISSKPSFDALSAIGNGWFFSKKEGEYLNDIKWSGTVQNGLINGKGIGYCKKGKICYLVSGEFVAGFPKGEVVFENYSYSDNVDKGLFWSTRITFGEMSDGMAWMKRSSDSKYGFVNSNGNYVVTDKYERVIKSFRNGRAEVVMNYGTTDNETNCSSCSGRGAVAGCSTCGGDGYTGWSDDVRCSTCNGTGAHKCSTCNGKGRVKVKGAPINKEIVIDKNGRFVDYNDHQKAMDEAERIAAENAERARQQRIQDSLDRIEQLRLEAEAKKAELERLVAINCNHKLWSKGDHICYVLPDGYYEGKLTCGTLEEWNENRSKAQIKIVTSPSNSATYNGELLQKNNTFWISTQGTKWHLALEGEFEASLTYDNSVKGPDVIYRDNPSSSSGPKRYDDCSTCKGSGKIECSSCGGDGRSGWSNDEFCTSCNGSGMSRCYNCRGTGRQ